jgi:hypothetical protein
MGVFPNSTSPLSENSGSSRAEFPRLRHRPAIHLDETG